MSKSNKKARYHFISMPPIALFDAAGATTATETIPTGDKAPPLVAVDQKAESTLISVPVPETEQVDPQPTAISSLPLPIGASTPIDSIQPKIDEVSSPHVILPEQPVSLIGDSSVSIPINPVDSPVLTATVEPEPSTNEVEQSEVEVEENQQVLETKIPLEDLEPLPEEESKNNLVVIDKQVEGYQDLVKLNTASTVILVDETTTAQDLSQMILDLESNVLFDSIEIFSHSLKLGAEDYSSLDDINADSEAWESIGESLSPNANIKWFGCNASESESGKSILNAMANFASTTVFASDNETGVGGDFLLEYSTNPSIVAPERSSSFTDEQLEAADVSLMFISGGIINEWTYQEPLPNGNIELHFNRLIDSAADAAVRWQDAENYAHAYSTTIDGENLPDWHLYEWSSKAEYDAFTNSMSQAEWNRFNGAVFSGYDVQGDNSFIFRDNQGDRYLDAIGGGWENPNNSNGPNYAPWDTSDGQENFSERLPVIIGGVRGDNGDPTNEQGQLHDVRDGDSSEVHEPDAIIIQTSVTLTQPQMLADSTANVIVESREDGTQRDSAQFLQGVNINSGENMHFDRLQVPLNGFDGEHQVNFNGALVPNSAEAVLNHTIVNGVITVTAAPNAEPTDAQVDAYLSGFVISLTANGEDQPDLTSLTSNMTLQTTDDFGQGITMSDTQTLEVAFVDRPDATPGVTGPQTNSGHSDIPVDYDLSQVGDIGDVANVHGVMVEGGPAIEPWQNFELESRDNPLSDFKMIVDQPASLSGGGFVLTQPAAAASFTVSLVNDASGTYYHFEPSTPGGTIPVADIEAFIQGQTIQLVTEDADAQKLTFSYEYTDSTGLTDASVDGYQGIKPTGTDSDFGKTVISVLPLNTVSEIDLDPDLGVVVEEGGYSFPFENFEVSDVDSDIGAIAIDISSGWQDGETEFNFDDLQANHPNFNIDYNESTGQLIFSSALTNGDFPSADEYQEAIRDIGLKCADNQPNLDPINGSLTVFDSVNAEDVPYSSLAEILAGDQTVSSVFNVEVVDRLEVSAGAPGQGDNTGHDSIPEQIKTDEFYNQFPQSALDDAQGIYVENSDPINAFDDAVFEQRQTHVEQINIEIQSGWVSGQSEWVVDTSAFAALNIEVTIDNGGNVSFNPVNGDGFQASDLTDLMQSGALGFQANGENVTASTIEFIMTGADGNNLSETSEDTANNVDADANGVYTIIQLGVNDGPEISIPNNPSDGNESSHICATAVIEGGDPVFPLNGIVISDVDSPNMQSASVTFEDTLPEDVNVFLTDEALSLISEYQLDYEITTEGVSLIGEAPVDIYNGVLAGVGFSLPDDDSQNRSSISIALNVSVNDVSTTGFGDDLVTNESTCFIAQNESEEIPATAFIEEEESANRHIIDNNDFDALVTLDVIKSEYPTNAHIHALVNDMKGVLDAQTSDTSGLHVLKQSSEVKPGDINPLVTPSLESKISAANDAVQASFIEQAAKGISLGNA